MHFLFILMILCSVFPLLITILFFFKCSDCVYLILSKLSFIFDKALQYLGLIISFLLIIMILIVMMIIFSRYLFDISSTKLTESIVYFHASVFLLTAPMTLSDDAHVRIDLFYTQKSDFYKTFINFIGSYLILIPVCLMIFITSQDYVLNSWKIKEASLETNGLPFVFLLKTLIPVFAFLMLIQGVAIASSCLVNLLNLKGKTHLAKKGNI